MGNFESARKLRAKLNGAEKTEPKENERSDGEADISCERSEAEQKEPVKTVTKKERKSKNGK